MGNCCEVFDTRLEELAGIDKKDSFATVCSSDSMSGKEGEDKAVRIRQRIKKLNTIIEDYQEDYISSPFLIKPGKFE